MQRTRHECPGIITTTVRKDLMALLTEYWSWQQPPRHHCGHLRTSRSVIVIGAISPGENSIGGSERQHNTVPDLRRTRVRSAGHWPRSGRRFAPARTVRPRSFSCRRLAQGSGRAEDGVEAAGGPTGWRMPQDKSENRSGNHHDDNLRKQACTAVKHALQAEQLGQGGRGAESKDGEAY